MPPPPDPRPPARVAPLAPLAVAAAVGVAVDRFAEPWGTLVWLAIAAGLGVFAVVLDGRPRRAPALVMLACLALAGGWHHYRWSDLADDDLARVVDEVARPVWARGVLLDVLGFRPGREPDQSGVTRAVLVLSEVYGDDGWRAATGRSLLSVEGDRTDLRAGTAVETAGTLARVAGPLNPGEFDYRGFLRADGVRLRLSVDDPGGVWSAPAPPRGWSWLAVRGLGAVRAWSQARLARDLDPTAAPLAAALLLGRREGVDPDVNDAFARTGTTHLLAISGLHLQVLGLALGWTLRLLGVSRRPTFVAVMAATVTYSLLVGLMPSVVRSAAMTVTYCAAGLFDRHTRPANTFAAAALATLALNPAHLFDVGCQLSFLAVAAIAWAVGPVTAWVFREPDALVALERRFGANWKRWVRRAWRTVAEGMTLSTVVWLAAVPLVALRFHIFSPIGILLNVPLIPITSLALLAAGLALGLGAVWGPLGAPADWACSVLLALTDWIVRWGAALRWGHTFVAAPPWWWVLGFYLVLGLAAVAVVGRRPGWKALACLTVALVPLGVWQTLWPGRTAPEVEVLAVGHGLAVVIDDGGGRGAARLFDCGRMRDPSVGRRIVAPALWARGVWRLDAVILSHPDADHYNGLPDVLDRFPTRVVLVPPGFDADPGGRALLDQVRARGVPVQTITAGDRWGTDREGFTLLVRHPPAAWDATTASDNARSVVLDVSASGHRILLTGDLDGPGLNEVVDHAPSGPAEIVLSPHHGGRTANPDWFYATLAPARVVVSQRRPAPGTRDPLDPLEAAGTPVLRTWQRGALRLRWSASGIKIRGFLDGVRR
jgi:competence protein ComEC